jgi:integrase/recombinase XerD
MTTKILFDSHYYRTWKKLCGLRDATIRRMNTTLKRLEDHMITSGFEGELNFDEYYYDDVADEYSPIDLDFFDEFVLHLKNQGATHYMLYNTIVEVRSFFKFLSDHELIQSNPVKGLKNQYYSRKLIDRSLSKEECILLLKAANKMDPFFRGYYLLVLVMLVTGLRSAEISQLTRNQIDLERGFITVSHGTKSTVKGVHIPKKVVEEFKRYFSHPVWLKWNLAGNQEVFFYHERKFYRDRLRLLLKEIAKEAGLMVNVYPHQLRHSCAHLMHEGGIDVAIIQRQLRHEHLYTTFRYLSPDKDEVEAQELLAKILEIEKEHDH